MNEPLDHRHADHGHPGQKHEEGHAHNHGAGANQRSLTIALALTSTYLIVEVVGGILTHSLALISDAAHMLTDTIALTIALMAFQIGKRPADAKRTFGYHRFEILAATFNAMLLVLVAAYILYEAYVRLKAPPEIQSTQMLIIAVIGLAVNLLSMRVLVSGQKSNMNMKGAYLEVWADMVGSVGVIVGAVVIKFTDLTWVDSAVAILIGLWVVPRTWMLLKSCINILLEGVPDEIDLPEVEAALLAHPGVASLHDLHIWAVTTGKMTLTVHLVTKPGVDDEVEVMPSVRSLLQSKFGITHITVQCEKTPCHLLDQTDHFKAPPVTVRPLDSTARTAGAGDKPASRTAGEGDDPARPE